MLPGKPYIGDFLPGQKAGMYYFSGNNNTTTNRYKIAVTPSATRSLSYDANGNLTSLPLTANSSLSCTWDAANRLVQIQQPTANGLQLTAFEYDGLGRRTRITEKLNGSVISDKQFVFDGLAMVEERDGNGNVVKEFFYEGFKILTGPNAGTYFYVRDHEGSIRAIINSSGVVVARYDYDSFGRMTLVSGIDIADFGFQGMYVLRVPGMAYPVNLTWARIYDPDLGRWWSRDWVESVNQYPGMGNNPMNNSDSLGLDINDVMRVTFTYPEDPITAQRRQWANESAARFQDEIIPRYGNWIAPDWSGGWRPSRHGGLAGPLSPIDAFDTAGMHHDIAYGHAGVQAGDPNSDCWKIKDPCARKKCYQKKAADNKLVNDALAATPPGLYGQLMRRGILLKIAPFNSKENVSYFLWHNPNN